MNCTTFRKFTGAFADGELEVRENLEALEHLKMCPACADRVEEIAKQRSSLRRIWGGQAAPLHLHRRVGDAIQFENETVGAPSLTDNPGYQDQAPPRSPNFRFRTPVLSLVMMVLVMMVLWPWVGTGRRRQASAAEPFVRAVRAHHAACTAWQQADLPGWQEVDQFRESARQELSLRVAAPILGMNGFRIRSGCRCDLAGVSGTHLGYETSDTGKRLSVFTTPRIGALQPATPNQSSRGSYFFEVDQEAPSVIVWHDDSRTITVCSAIPPNLLLAMFDQIVAVADRTGTIESTKLAYAESPVYLP